MSDPRTDPQGDRFPHIPAALAATYPLRCFAPQWARFDNRHSTKRTSPYPHCCQRQRRKDSFAPRRERFFCLRRPHFFQQRKKWGKERRQKLRFCTSSARYTCLLPSSFFLTRPAFSYPLSVSRLCLHSFPLPLPVTMVKIIRSAVSQAKK